MRHALFQFALLAVSFGASLFLTNLARKILAQRAMLDLPNERSLHAVPVPRGGGWAVIGVLFIGLSFAFYLGHAPKNYVGILLAITLLVFISGMDDRKGMKARTRLSCHILAACLGSLAFGTDQTLFGGALPFWLDRAVMIIGWAWFMNLYNFMDGIDGITGVETISLATGGCLLLSVIGLYDPFLSTLTLLLTGTCLGFLALNWHPAKIFLGDVGSVPLGFLTGFLLLMLAVHGALIPALILPLYYLADSGITIGKRALRGEKIWQAHRQHFYQTAALRRGRHDRVVLEIVAANIGLIAAAFLAVFYPSPGLLLAMAIVAILLRRMHKAKP